ncbi:MAG: insulinase family protein, partial [Campylobacteraceae bacterium]|nr:insulinase family protein [Campylobacteraceae bacterium]
YAKFSVGNSSSYMSGHLQTKNENRDEAKKIVKEVIEEFVKNGVTNNELEQAKKFLLGSEPLRLETLSQRMSRSFSEFYKGLEIGYVKQELELIEKLSLEELNEFIASHKEIVELTFSIVTNEDNRPKR